MSDWKHCLVKWAGLEFQESTWESTSCLELVYPDARKAFEEYVNQRRIEFLAKHDARHRVKLIQGRRQVLGFNITE